MNKLYEQRDPWPGTAFIIRLYILLFPSWFSNRMPSSRYYDRNFFVTHETDCEFFTGIVAKCATKPSFERRDFLAF